MPFRKAVVVLRKQGTLRTKGTMYVEKSDQVAECLASAELCVAVVAPYAFKTEHNLVLSQWFWNRGKRYFILFLEIKPSMELFVSLIPF